jgi:hypothetical protein
LSLVEEVLFRTGSIVSLPVVDHPDYLRTNVLVQNDAHPGIGG